MRNAKLTLQPRLPSFLQAGLLLLAALMMYAGSLSAPLVFDDGTFFDEPALIERFRHAYFSLDLRWISYASFSWMLDRFGLDMFWLRLVNVLLHAANAIALFFLLRRLFQVTLCGDDTIPPALSWLAFFGALLFTLHPVAVYGVAYLIQRSTLMATGFMLLMLLTYLEGILRENWRWMLLAALCYFAAVFSKEHSIAAPGVALALTPLVKKPSLALLKRIAPFYLFAALIALAVTWSTIDLKGALGSIYEPNAAGMLRQAANPAGAPNQASNPAEPPKQAANPAGAPGQTANPGAALHQTANAAGMLDQAAKVQGLTELPHAHLLSILTQSYLFFKYLWLWLLPNPAWMSVDMREPFAASLSGWPQVLGLVAFPAYFCVAVWLLLKRGRAGLLGFALLFPWILFLSEGATVRIQEPFVLYRSYMWMPGLFAALPALLAWRPFAHPAAPLRDVLPEPVATTPCKPARPPTAFIMLGCICLLFAPLTLNRLHTFSSSLLLWDDAEKLVRDKPYVFGVERIYYNRGTEFGHLNRLREALGDFNKSISANPNIEFAYGNRATTYYFLGDYLSALRDYDRALTLNPDNPSAYYGRALTHRNLGNLAEEQEDLNNSCALGGACQ